MASLKVPHIRYHVGIGENFTFYGVILLYINYMGYIGSVMYCSMFIMYNNRVDTLTNLL